MNVERAATAWNAVREADPAGLTSAELSEWFDQLRHVRAVCDAAEVRAVRRRQELSSAAGVAAAEAQVSTEANVSGRDAQRAVEREAFCAAAPSFHEALTAGTVSSGHVDAAAAALRQIDGVAAERFAELAPDLAARAAHVGVDAFATECRDLARHPRRQADHEAEVTELERQRSESTVKRWVDRVTGMHHTLVTLDPLRDSMVWKAISAELAALRNEPSGDRTWAQLQVDAVVAAVTSVPSEAVRSALPEVSVLIDWATLIDDAHASGVCTTDGDVPLPVATVRRLCCEAQILPVVLGEHGEALDVGRARRTASRAQRRALAAMYRGCAFPGCNIGFDACRIHHVRFWWEHRGRTDLHNLLPLCEQHHHLVHEGRWTLTMDAERVATWRRADGVVHARGPTIDRRPVQGFAPADTSQSRPNVREPMLC